MPLPKEVDATTPKYLRDKYAIVGVGETTYTRGSNKTTRALGTWAVRTAILDAGMKPTDIDGMLDYSGGDSTSATFIAGDLGIRLNFYMDVVGGGSSTEALVGIAIGLIEAGCCKTVAIFRSMNGFSQVRIGGTGARSAAPLQGDMLHNRAYGWQSAGQSFAPTFMRHMYDYGTKPEQVAMVKVAHSHHASNNPKAYYKKRFTVEDVLSSRFICKPLHLLDCCVETDNANAIVVTSAERARNCRHPLVLIRGVVGRCNKPRLDMHYQHGPISRVAGYYAKDILWPNAGLGPDELDVENVEDFKHCAAHDFHLQACAQCNRLRYPPTTACPWCMSRESTWKKVEGKGAVHSYTEVHHAIQPSFRAKTPYMVLLVDLDTQKGEPTPDEALRVIGNLCTPDGQLAAPDMVKRVGVGTRVRMVFSDVSEGIALPQWTIDETAQQPD